MVVSTSRTNAWPLASLTSKRIGMTIVPRSAAIVLSLVALNGCDPASVAHVRERLTEATTNMAGSFQELIGQQPLAGQVATSANLRDGPGTNHARLGQVPAGRAFLLTGRQENWYQVTFTDTAEPTTGWLRGDLVTLTIPTGQQRAAEVMASVSLREAPNNSAAVTGSLTKNSKAQIVEAKDGWLKVKQGTIEGWASGQHVVAALPAPGTETSPSFLAGLKNQSVQTASLSQAQAAKRDPSTWVLPDGSMKPLETRIESAGYTVAFQGVRAMARNGAFELALDELGKLSAGSISEIEPAAGPGENGVIEASVAPTQDSSADSWGFFSPDDMHMALERGTLLLEKGELGTAVATFEEAENALGKRQQRSRAGDFFTSAASLIVGAVSGKGDFGPYNLEPYEEILFLNYKTIGYLLQGKREAYNVSRRATNRQNELRDEFAELIENAKKEQSFPRNDDNETEARSQIAKVSNWLLEIGKRYDVGGTRVPSAYVNPFGFYVVGMVNEIESYADPSLRDNARIAYGKALELNPSSPVLRRATAAMEKSFARADHKVIHVLGSIGMAPEKRVASFGLPLTELQTVLPLKFPVYEVVPDVVTRIEVRDVTGQRLLGELSALADVEAMVLRYQKDRLPAEIGRFVLGLYPRLAERNFWSGFGTIGQAIADGRETTINPDMRAWLALPATFHAARLELPKNTSRLQIRSFDAAGRELGREMIDLPGDNHGFAYVRAVEKVLTVQAGEASWVEH